MEKVQRESPSQGLDNLEATYKEIGGGLNARHKTRHTYFEKRNKMWSFTLSNEEPQCMRVITLYDDMWRVFFFFLYAWTCVDSHALSHKQHKQCRHWNREGTVTYLFFSLLGFKNSQVWLLFLFGETSRETPCCVFVFFLPWLVPNRFVFTLLRRCHRLRHCCCCNNQLMSIIKAYFSFCKFFLCSIHNSVSFFFAIFIYYYFCNLKFIANRGSRREAKAGLQDQKGQRWSDKSQSLLLFQTWRNQPDKQRQGRAVMLVGARLMWVVDTFIIWRSAWCNPGLYFGNPPCLSDDVLLHRCSVGHQSSTGQ